jgi:hypothetical protein
MPNTIKVAIDGKEHEVQVPEDQFVPKEDLDDKYVLKSFHESQLNKAGASTRKSVEEELRNSDKFFAELAKSKGVPIDDSGKYKKPEGEKIDIEKIRNETADAIREKEVGPLSQKLGRLLDSQLVAETIQAGSEAGIKRSLMRSIRDGAPPLIVSLVRDQVAFDEEHNYFALKNGEKFEYNPNGNETRPYKGIRELFEGMKKDQAYADYFEDTRQRGSGFQGKQSGSGMVVKKRSEMTATEKSEYIKEFGSDEFRKLPA